MTNGGKSLSSLHRFAWLLDDAIGIPGTRIRFGLDSLLGLLPAGGDLAGGALSAYTMVAAAKLGAGPAVIVRMALNVLLDMLIGTVPILGDLFDVGWKANRRNVALLDQFVADPAPVKRHSYGVVVIMIAVLIAAMIGAAVLAITVMKWIIGIF